MEASSAAEREIRGFTGSAELARNALGLPQVLFCIVTGAAPLAAMLFNTPLSIRGVGIGVPATFWIATVAFAFFSVGYVEMARRVTTAGGIYSFMSYGFGRIIGLGSAVAVAASYMLFTVGVNGVTSYFANTSVSTLSDTDGDGVGFNMDWRLWAFLFILTMFLITYFHIEIVARILGIALMGELVVLLLFSFAVLFQGGKDGISFEPLNPATIFSGGAGFEGSERVFAGVGGAAAGVGLFAAFWSWVGFEMAPNYAEESRNPKKLMAYAIYISCIGLGILYTFVTWMLVNAYGKGDQSVWAVSAQYGIDPEKGPANAGFPNGDFTSIYYPVTKEFMGSGLTDLFKILIVTGSFACSLAFWNTANRYLFAMGRERILPSALGRTHATHKSPFVAGATVLVFCVGVTAMFALGGAGTGFQETLGIKTSDPIVALFEVGTWLPFQGNMLLFALMSVVNIAILIYFLREGRDGFHWFKTFLAPIIGAGGIAFAYYLMMKNRAFLTTGEYAGWTKAVPYYTVGIFLGGVVLALIYRYRSRERYEAVGKFVHEEA